MSRPASPSAPTAATSATVAPPDRPIWPVLGGFFVLLLVLAALRPLAVPDEGRYADIGRWMVLSGDWLTPRLNGLPFFHKPPLTHWLQAISISVLGVHPLSLRLVPALHALALLTLVWHLGRRLAGALLARRAVWMLGSSLGFLIAGQYINHDMGVATWIALAISAFALSFLAGPQPDPGLARWGFVACALGVLTKGLIGLALPGLVLLPWLIVTRQFGKVWRLPWASGLALFALIALPWFVLMERHSPGFAHYLFIGQQFQRYTASGFNNPQPVWFYALALLLLLGVWGPFALAQRRRVLASESALAQPVHPALWLLCWIWLGAISLFFSIPQSKLVGYILPVLPPLVLLAALGWTRVMGARAWAGRAFGALVGVQIALAVGLNQLVGPVTASARSADVAAALACAAAPGEPIAVASAYPYDLPLLLRTQQPLVVLGDWPKWRRDAGDNWARELFDGADFDPAAGAVLQDEGWIARVAGQPGHWLVVRHDHPLAPRAQPGWVLFKQGAGWAVWRTQSAQTATNNIATSAPESPPAGQHIGLPGCRQHAQP